MSFTLRNLPVPITFGESIELGNGEVIAAEKVLTYIQEQKTNQTLDYIFELAKLNLGEKSVINLINKTKYYLKGK